MQTRTARVWWQRLRAGRPAGLVLAWLCGVAIGALVVAPTYDERKMVAAEVAPLPQA